MTSVSTTPESSAAIPGPDDGCGWTRMLAPLCLVAIVGRGVLVLPATVHQHLGRLGVHPLDDLAADDCLALVALWNLATYWFVMVATMPGLTIPAGRRRHRVEHRSVEHGSRRRRDRYRDELRDVRVLGVLAFA